MMGYLTTWRVTSNGTDEFVTEPLVDFEVFPETVDLDIRDAQGLSVRKHPNGSGVLLVDAFAVSMIGERVIKEAFEQRYPAYHLWRYPN